MSVQETSLFAWSDIQEKLGDRQQEVYEMLSRCRVPVSNNELAKIMGWEINRLTPRVNELRKLGKVIEAGKRKCHCTGRTVLTWKIKGAL